MDNVCVGAPLVGAPILGYPIKIYRYTPPMLTIQRTMTRVDWSQKMGGRHKTYPQYCSV